MPPQKSQSLARNRRKRRKLGVEFLESRDLLSAGMLDLQPVVATATPRAAYPAAMAGTVTPIAMSDSQLSAVIGATSSDSSIPTAGGGGAGSMSGAVVSGSSNTTAREYTRSDGDIYVLKANHDLILETPAPAEMQIRNFGVVKAFALRSISTLPRKISISAK